MSRKYDNVIVFGPTGAVGGAAALEASKRGAKVWLAMRDPAKTIDDLPADVEQAGNFERVKADLTDAASVAEAVNKSGAKAAFIYLIFGSPDGQRASLQALRDAGVEHVVFLSSYSIAPGVDPREIPQSDFIPYAHAQVEIGIQEVGFPYSTLLRPAYFASNHLKNHMDTSVTPPKLLYPYPDSIWDNIVPEDIGGVGGATLVDRPSDGHEVIYLCGPKLLTQEEANACIRKVTGRDDIDMSPTSLEGYVRGTVKKGTPEVIARYMADYVGKYRDAEKAWPESFYKPAVANVKKYLGRDATEFEDYLAAHKAEWLAL